MEKNLKRGLSQGATSPEAKTFPGLPELALLRVIGALWPTSDMHHAVVTPTRVLMGAYLGLGRVRSLRDLASGLFLCTLCLSFESRSKRFVPEALNFALNAVLHLAPHRFRAPADLSGSFPCPDFRETHSAGLALNAKKSQSRPDTAKPDIVSILAQDDSAHGEDVKVDLLNVAFEVLAQFAEMYKGLDGFPELFGPILDVLEGLHQNKLPSSLQVC
jgi:nucleolar protein 14